MSDIVIGSGPAGVAAAKALLARGRAVTMIDVGERLEPDREALRARLAEGEPHGWDPQALADYKAPQLNQGPDEIHRYGSDFLVRDREGLIADRPDWFALRASFARGGLSNGWGAAVLPYRQADLAGWPIGIDELAPHYREVAGFMPVAGRSDDLDALFPAQDMSQTRPLAASTQAEALLGRIEKGRERLRRMNVVGGAARQAAVQDCRRCGLCLHGCPYEYVFKASQVVDAMLRQPDFEYLPGLRAVSFSEEADGVRVVCRRADGSSQAFRGERLFVGAGVLSTAQLVLAALGAPDQELVLADSQHFFLPLLHLWPTQADPAAEQRHALTQVFLEVVDPELSPFTVHAQLYTYSEFYALDMRSRYGRKLPMSGPLFDALGRRLIVSQVFLHSEHSHSIGLRLGGAAGKLAARLIENPATAVTTARARARYAKAAAALGLVALTPASRPGAPGSSFHAGGSTPMRRTPRGLETDTLGRPAGLARVHLIDASVFPTIPATTITYSVMANAHRIAAHAG